MLDYSSKPADRPAIDPLTRILSELRLEGIEYGRSVLGEPWAFSFPAQDEAYFHFVGDRNCWLRTPAEEWVELGAGDAVLLPRGGAHALASAPGAVTAPFPPWRSSTAWGEVTPLMGAVPATILFCVSMRFNFDREHPLLRIMPDVMRGKAHMDREASTLLLLDAMGREIAMNRVGACGIVARLADVLAAQIIRDWVESSTSDATGWIAAIRHPGIGRVLAAIHANPATDWTVKSLADLMGASRSSFAGKFMAIVGETPARYIAQVRMHQARQWIVRDGTRISLVAERLGFDSEATFSRSFKRVLGVPPSHYKNRMERIG